jgi:hypothetical protein
MRDGTGRSIALISAAAFALGGLWVATRGQPPALVAVAPPAPSTTILPPEEPEDEARSYSFRIPSGEPTSLACAEARRIVEQVRSGLAYEPEPVQARAFAESASDWLDPHELWALGTDAPTALSLEKHAAELIGEIEGRKLDDCAAAHAVGEVLVPWVEELRVVFDAARADAASGAKVEDALREPIIAAATTRIVARDLAGSLGRRVGAFERALGDAGRTYSDAARERFFPTLDVEGWARVVLAASVRAYVPLVDPHGAWAPFDEEASVYEVELSARPPNRLWQSGDFTAIGFRVKEGVSAPLASCSARAITSLPLPVSPTRRTATRDAATRSTRWSRLARFCIACSSGLDSAGSAMSSCAPSRFSQWRRFSRSVGAGPRCRDPRAQKLITAVGQCKGWAAEFWQGRGQRVGRDNLRTRPKRRIVTN